MFCETFRCFALSLFCDMLFRKNRDVKQMKHLTKWPFISLVSLFAKQKYTISSKMLVCWREVNRSFSILLLFCKMFRILLFRDMFHKIFHETDVLILLFLETALKCFVKP